jgi:hypothetical protein
LVAEKKDDFGNALQNLYRELERAEECSGTGELTLRILGSKELHWHSGGQAQFNNEEGEPDWTLL